MIYRPSLWARVSRDTICSRFIFKYSQWARRGPAARLAVSRSRVVLRVVSWFTVNDSWLFSWSAVAFVAYPCMLRVVSSCIHAVALPGWRSVVLQVVPWFTVFHSSLFDHVLIRICSCLCACHCASSCLFTYKLSMLSSFLVDAVSSCWYFHDLRFTIARSLPWSGSGVVFLLILAHILLYIPVFTQCQYT